MLSRVILAGGSLALVLAPGAWASSAEMQDSYLVYKADMGEVNVVSIVHSDDGLITVTDTGAIIQGTNGCVAKDVHVAECGHPSLPEGGDLHWHSVYLGDGDDSFEVFGLKQGVLTNYSVAGDQGDDILSGGGERDYLNGGDGADRLEGGDGDDSLNGGAGADVMRGGFGVDTVSYFERTASVRVEIGDGPGDGEPGEGDDVQADNVEGGTGDDVLVGNMVGNKLDGGPGEDVLSGRAGDDELLGTDAQVSGDPSVADRMRCGAGIDTAHLSGPDLAPDNCEQLAHDTLLRLGMTALDRPRPRRLRTTVRRLDTNYTTASAQAQAQLHVPCGPVRDDGTRCWRRVGRSRDAVPIVADGESALIDVILSRAGRSWLGEHPQRRPRLTVLAYLADSPDYPVELRLRVQVPQG